MLAILLTFAMLAIAVLVSMHISKNWKLQDFQTTMASGSRDPKAHYALQRSGRTKNFLLILLVVVVIYMLIPKRETRIYRQPPEETKDSISPAQQKSNKGTFIGGKYVERNY